MTDRGEPTMKISLTTQKRITILFALVLRALMVYLSLVFYIIGSLIMSPWNKEHRDDHPSTYIISVSNFISGIIIILLALAVPLVINSWLYHCWYKKKSISKLWVRIPDIICSVALILFVIHILFSNGFNSWIQADWEW